MTLHACVKGRHWFVSAANLKLVDICFLAVAFLVSAHDWIVIVSKHLVGSNRVEPRGWRESTECQCLIEECSTGRKHTNGSLQSLKTIIATNNVVSPLEFEILGFVVRIFQLHPRNRQ